MHAYIISGQDRDERHRTIAARKKEWGVSAFDTVILGSDGLSIGIGAVRNFQKRIHFRPHNSPITLGVIEDAHILTEAAQHALLKTLEEPPEHARIIMETETPSLLLPTILSRCQLVSLGNLPLHPDKSNVASILLAKLPFLTPGEKLRLIEGIAQSREEANAWIDCALFACYTTTYARIRVMDSQSRPTHMVPHVERLVPLLERARSQIAANCNWRLVLDVFALSYA